jgi:hypothetical protein
MTINYVNPTQYGIWITLSSIISWFSFFDIGFGYGLSSRFAGIEGELYRIMGHKRVVVKLGNSLAVATSYIAKEHLERV